MFNAFKGLFKEVSDNRLRRYRLSFSSVHQSTPPHLHLTSSRSLTQTYAQAGVKDVVTLFHSPKSPASVRVFTLLKQNAANSQANATMDQASSHDQQSKTERTEFELGMQRLRILPKDRDTMVWDLSLIGTRCSRRRAY